MISFVVRKVGGVLRCLIGMGLVVVNAWGATGLIRIPPTRSMAEIQAQIQQWENSLTFELVGIGSVADVPVAILAVNGNLCTVMAGISLGGRLVDDIDVANQRVTLSRRDHSASVLVLTAAEPIGIPPMADSQRQYLLSKEGRKATYRLETPEPLRQWTTLSRAEQSKVLLQCLDQGLVVGSARSGESYAGRLLERQIAEITKRKREAFLAALTPEQRNAYAQPQAVLRLGDPSIDRVKIAAEVAATTERRNKVIASLTAEQRALYDDLQSWLKP